MDSRLTDEGQAGEFPTEGLSQRIRPQLAGQISWSSPGILKTDVRGFKKHIPVFFFGGSTLSQDTDPYIGSLHRDVRISIFILLEGLLLCKYRRIKLES